MVFFMLPLTPLALKLTEGPQKEESEVKWPYREDLKKKEAKEERANFNRAI